MGFLFDQMVSQKIGFLFPGQGAQYVGMGSEWARQFESARGVFQEADHLLNFSLSKICFEGPEETLTRTLHAQPAIYVTSLAFLAVLTEKRGALKPDFVAGLSLGEFTALTAAGALSFTEGVKLVQARAQLMENSAREVQGTMISVLGLTQEECQSIAKESGSQLANLNASDQFVLSGRTAAIEKAAQLAEGMGAKRVIQLKVGGAFHSSLMNSAKEGFREALKKISIKKPSCVFVANASAEVEAEPEKIRTLLAEQLTSPVRWIETMERAHSHGIRRFIEIGPGRVLKGLAKRIDSTLEVFSLEKVADLENLESVLERAQ